MKQLPYYMQGPERPRSLDELRSRLNRRLSDMREGWRRCDNGLCRRWKQCCGEGPEVKCTDDGRPRRELSPEQSAKVRSDLYKAIKARRAELAAGVKPPDAERRANCATSRALPRGAGENLLWPWRPTLSPSSRRRPGPITPGGHDYGEAVQQRH